MPKQLEIAGTETPKNPDIEQAIDLWLEAKVEQRRAADTAKLRHATLLLHMQNAGCDTYPFVDPTTGKKRQVAIARDPKAKNLKAPRWDRRDRDVEEPPEVKVEDLESDGKVESRRVKRSTVKNADQVVDPFASTRSAMADADVTPISNGKR